MTTDSELACNGPTGGGCSYDNHADCILTYPAELPVLGGEERTVCSICLEKAIDGYQHGAEWRGQPSDDLQLEWIDDRDT